MRVKIVTDSTSDMSPDLATSLGIEVVPGYIRFAKDTYRDGVDISKSGCRLIHCLYTLILFKIP